MVPMRYTHAHTNPGPFNPPARGQILPAIQCYVVHGDIFNMKKQSNPFLVKPIENAEEVPPVYRKTVEDNLPILTVPSGRIIRGSFRMFAESTYF